MALVTERWLIQEFSKRANQAGLKVDCLGAGDANSEVMIIGEAPGERETSLKMPMVGGSGRMLWEALRRYNITRANTYTTNVVKRQLVLSTKAKAKSPIKPQELEHWEGLLDWEIDQLPNLKYILCLGKFALRALTGEQLITNWRGSVNDVIVGRNRRQVKIVFAFNPAHILRERRWETIFHFDMAKLNMVMEGNYEPHKIKARINPSTEEALHFIDELTNEDAPISLDIETMANETACIGFANNAHEGMCINFRTLRENHYKLSEEVLLRGRIQQLLDDPSKRFIAQSGSFDSYWLHYKDRIKIPKIWFDTLLAHHTLYPAMPHNLGFLTSQYTTHPFYKDEGKNWKEGGDIDQFWGYNVKDCCITWAAHDKLHKELKQQDLDKFFFEHVMRLQPHLVQMTVGGVLADVALKDKIAEELGEEVNAQLKSIHARIHRLTSDPDYSPNLNSPPQLRKLFFDRLGLIGRGTSTDKINREYMRNHPSITQGKVDLLKDIDTYKEEHKFLTTYARSKLDEDNRIRCEYKQYGTQKAPGRLSSAQTLWGSGMNLQNQPKRAYKMFIADPNYMFSYFDLKQAEAKIVAYQWKVLGLIENFKKAEASDKFDVHRGNAAMIFKVPYEEIPTEDHDENLKPTKRFLGKRCVHGLNYRMMAPKLAEVCGIPISQAHEAFANYHHAFPEIQQAWRDTIDRVREDRMLFTPLGRRMIFMGIITEEMLDSVIAFVPQSTIGDKVSSVIYECHDHPDWPTKHARMALNIHDALIALHLQDQGITETVQGIMKECAESPILIRGEQVSIGTDFKTSQPDKDGVHRWSTLK